MSLVDEYLAITGRPAFTLTVDEFLKLREPSTVTKAVTPVIDTNSVNPTVETISVKENTDVIRETPKASVSDKKVENSIPVSTVPSPKKEKDILALLKRVPG